MKNYEEKEKKLDNVLKKLNTMSNKVVKMNNDIDSLSLEYFKSRCVASSTRFSSWPSSHDNK